MEFAGLLAHPDVARRNVTAMPKWEKRRSLLLRRMAEKEVTSFRPDACLGDAWDLVGQASLCSMLALLMCGTLWEKEASTACFAG